MRPDRKLGLPDNVNLWVNINLKVK
jgi:hypothetical protein